MNVCSRRFLAMCLMVVLFLAGLPNGAAAGGVNGSGDLETNGADTTLTIEDVLGGVSVSPSVPAWMLECTWKRSTRVEAAIQSFYYEFFHQNGAEDRQVIIDRMIAQDQDPEDPFWLMYCPNNATTRSINPEVAFINLFASWQVGDSPPQYVIDILVAQTMASVEITPQIGQGAPYGDVDAPMITQLPTWLWVEPAVFQPITETSPVVFDVYSVTVTGVPTGLTFKTTEGDAANCPDGGKPYDFGRSDDAQSTDCSVTFRHSSAVTDHVLSSTIIWTFDWACNPGCGGAPLGDIPITVNRDVRVAELQAVGVD